VPRTIGLSTTFQANGTLFHVRNVETMLAANEPPSTLPFTQNLRASHDGSGMLFGDVTVFAQSAGTSGNLVRGTELPLHQSVLPYFVRAVAMETFPDIRDSSVLGAGDAEMTRDKHTVFPGATGGYADWYVGTTRQLQSVAPRVRITVSLDSRRFCVNGRVEGGSLAASIVSTLRTWKSVPFA
jgi:hypothetical protein